MDEVTASTDIWWCVNTNSEEKLLRKLQGDMTMSEIKKKRNKKKMYAKFHEKKSWQWNLLACGSVSLDKIWGDGMPCDT